MLIPQIWFVTCDRCGKLMRVEKIRDMLTPMDLKRLASQQKKNYCEKCAVKYRLNK